MPHDRSDFLLASVSRLLLLSALMLVLVILFTRVLFREQLKRTQLLSPQHRSSQVRVQSPYQQSCAKRIENARDDITRWSH